MLGGIPTQITDNIFLGSSTDSQDDNILKLLEITHILVAGSYLIAHHPYKFEYKTISIEDDEDYDISSHFEEAYNFIEEALHY